MVSFCTLAGGCSRLRFLIRTPYCAFGQAKVWVEDDSEAARSLFVACVSSPQHSDGTSGFATTSCGQASLSQFPITRAIFPLNYQSITHANGIDLERERERERQRERERGAERERDCTIAGGRPTRIEQHDCAV